MDEAARSTRRFQARADQMPSSLTIDAEKLPRRASPPRLPELVLRKVRRVAPLLLRFFDKGRFSVVD